MDALMREVFGGLPRQGPGADAYTRRAVEVAGLAGRTSARVPDVGCGSGAATLCLARAFPFEITATDRDSRLVARLRDGAGSMPRRGTVRCVLADMHALPFADESLDCVWSEGAIYIIGFAHGLRQWRRLLRPGGVVAVTELTWLTDEPPAEAAAFWADAYPAMTTVDANVAAAAAAGYRVHEPLVLGPDAFWPEFYEPLEARLAQLRDGYAAAAPERDLLAFVQREIDLYRAHDTAYSYVFYVCEAAR